MARPLLLLCFLSSAFFYAAPKYGVQKIWLFSKVRYSGNVPRLANKKPADGAATTLVCYLKISKNIESPDWQTAYIYGNEYGVKILPVTQDSVIIGTAKDTHSAIVIKAGPDSKLVQLVLIQRGKIEKPEAWGFILDGTLNGKDVYIRSNEPMVELSPDLMP